MKIAIETMETNYVAHYPRIRVVPRQNIRIAPARYFSLGRMQEIAALDDDNQNLEQATHLAAVAQWVKEAGLQIQPELVAKTEKGYWFLA